MLDNRDERILSAIIKNRVPIHAKAVSMLTDIPYTTVLLKLDNLIEQGKVEKAEVPGRTKFFKAILPDDVSKAANSPVVATLSWPISWGTDDVIVNKEMTVYEVLTGTVKGGVTHTLIIKILKSLIRETLDEGFTDEDKFDKSYDDIVACISKGESLLKSLKTTRAAMELFKAAGIIRVVLDEDPYADENKLTEAVQ